MTRALAFAILAGTLLAAGPAAAQKWDVLDYVDQVNDPKADPAIRSLWKDNVSKDPSWGLAYKTFTMGDAKVTVMVGLQDGCSSVNDVDAVQLYSTCPLNVVVERGGKVTTQRFEDACYIDTGNVQGRSVRKPSASNYVAAQVDPNGRSISIRTVQDGKAVPQCAKTIQVN